MCTSESEKQGGKGLPEIIRESQIITLEEKGSKKKKKRKCGERKQGKRNGKRGWFLGGRETDGERKNGYCCWQGGVN